MDYETHVAAVERETRAIAAVLGSCPMDAPVPTCPEWALRDLGTHLAEFTGFWTHVLCEGTGRPKTPYADRPDDPAIASWYADLAGHLVEELRATPPDTEVWTWVEHDSTARFTARRCANELAVHRHDAESAAGTPGPVDAELAADGIEEIFVMIPNWDQAPDGSGSTLHLHGTDRGDEWTIAMTASGLEVTRAHAPADLTLSGAVSDLELVLYHRPPLGPVERDGDSGVLDAWYREFTFG